jgi:hypothetical protein
MKLINYIIWALFHALQLGKQSGTMKCHFCGTQNSKISKFSAASFFGVLKDYFMIDEKNAAYTSYVK